MVPEAYVPHTFRRVERLHSHRDFQTVMKSGRRLAHPALFIYVYRRQDGVPLRRLGLVTSGKVGNAVCRNRLKRRLREIFRLHKHELLPGTDVIFVSRPEGASLDYRQLEDLVLSQWRKAKVIAEADAGQ